MFHPDGPNLYLIVLKQIPYISFPEFDRVIPDVNLVLCPTISNILMPGL